MEEGRAERELLTSLWHKTDKNTQTPDILPESVLQGPNFLHYTLLPISITSPRVSTNPEWIWGGGLMIQALPKAHPSVDIQTFNT